jgi:apolipoprotein N-acyltransferase
LPELEPGDLIASVTLDDRHPPYATFGRWPLIVLAAIGLGLLVTSGGIRGERPSDT